MISIVLAVYAAYLLWSARPGARASIVVGRGDVPWTGPVVDGMIMVPLLATAMLLARSIASVAGFVCSAIIVVLATVTTVRAAVVREDFIPWDDVLC